MVAEARRAGCSLQDAAQRGLHVRRVEQVAQPADVRHVLPDQLVDQAAGAELEVRVGQVARAHARSAARGDIGRVRDGADLVLVVLAVEQVRVRPGAALLEQSGGSRAANSASPR